MKFTRISRTHTSQYNVYIANDSDKHGKSSLYFEDRPPGYPDEELIEWCRTNEIIGEGGRKNGRSD